MSHELHVGSASNSPFFILKGFPTGLSPFVITCYLGGLPDPKGCIDQCCFMAMLRLCWPGIGPPDQHPSSTWKPIFWKGEWYPSCIPRTYISLGGSTELPRIGPSKVVVSPQNKLSAIYLTAWNLYPLLLGGNLESPPKLQP